MIEDIEMSKHAHFNLVYDGPALANHEMDVKDLAPALLAFSDLFNRANEILNDGRGEIKLAVKGTFKSGSFNVDLVLAQSLFQKLLEIGNSVGVTGVINMLTCFTVGKGVINLIIKAKGKHIEVIDLKGDGTVIVKIDEDQFEIEERVYKLVNDYKIRKALEQLIAKPLEREGVDTFAIVDVKAKNVKLLVDRKDAVYFLAPPSLQENEQIIQYVAFLEIISPSFHEGYKWKFGEGGDNFFASIADNIFLARVSKAEEQFSAGDLIKARIESRQSISNDGKLKKERTVLEVLEHIKTPMTKQIKMDLPRP